MRTLSFENLRRLVGRRKDRDEPSFERSESFKRISIRKSYLDRAKRRTRLQKPNDNLGPVCVTPTIELEVSSRPRTKNSKPAVSFIRNGNSNDSINDGNDEKRYKDESIVEIREELDEDDDYDDLKKVGKEIPDGTIIYGQWINEVDSSYSSSKDKKYGIDSFSSKGSKLSINLSSGEIYDSQEIRPFAKRNLAPLNGRKFDNVQENNKVSSIIIGLNKSPELSRSHSSIISQTDEIDAIKSFDNHGTKRSTTESSTSDGITRVNVSPFYWKDSNNTYTSNHHSLSINPEIDSSFKKESLPSSTYENCLPSERPSHKTDTTSTKASGFSLSLSISRLTTDLRAAALTTKNGLFRRRKRTSPLKPAPSVSTEGYFERTAGAAISMRRSRRSNLGSSRFRPTYNSRRRKITTNRPVIPKPPSPVWFVPPERRKSNRQHGRVWREVRYLPQQDKKSDVEDNENGEVLGNKDNENDNKNKSNTNCQNDSNQSDDQFDDNKLLLSGDFEEKTNLSISVSPKNKPDSGSTLDSSSLISSSLASTSSIKPKISDFNEDKIFYEEYRGDKSKSLQQIECNYFASKQFLRFIAKSTGRQASDLVKCDYTSSSDDDQRRVLVVVSSGSGNICKSVGKDNEINERKNCSVVLVLEDQRAKSSNAINAGLRRRPLRRKSQLKRGGGLAGGGGGNAGRGQPVYLARRRSSLRRRPCRKMQIDQIII
ncbi:hypothetical protein QAD02_023310 [Eretmocerus hayati]|uniref:Uncharacterized protein n=1 Tax=Eretmocerus hayati TaxID=131215 RepID=A0ACC2PVF9_9HYME|nr:hypothetical protein QAD02_023310 [Eretmocerus hayati]